jgi:hypothetical protein
MTDYAILAGPRISRAGFTQVLEASDSPAAPEAGKCYDAFVAAEVDPAVGLAMFRKESTFGKFGRANANRSWGNNRGGTAFPTDDKGFRVYPSWTAGAADAARLLAIYGRNGIKKNVQTSTVQTFPFVWAPSADGNAPDKYGDALTEWISEWSAAFPTQNEQHEEQDEEVEVYQFAMERWFIDGNPARLITTVGTPLRPDGTPDFKRRLALVSGKGGTNLRLMLFDRTRLTPVDWSNAAALTEALKTFSLPA